VHATQKKKSGGKKRHSLIIKKKNRPSQQEKDFRAGTKNSAAEGGWGVGGQGRRLPARFFPAILTVSGCRRWRGALLLNPSNDSCTIVKRGRGKPRAARGEKKDKLVPTPGRTLNDWSGGK